MFRIICSYGFLLVMLCLWNISVSQSFEKTQPFTDSQSLTNVSGVSVADYDLDGDLDLFLVAAEVFDSENPRTWSKLLRNNGSGGFEDVTLTAGIINLERKGRDGTNGSKMGASWGDFDNDGDPDLYLSNYGFDELWRNEGDGTFINVTEESGLGGCEFCYSTNAVWWDYDNDGDLDIYVSDWIKRNRFFRNDGEDGFVNIAEMTELDDRGQTFTSLPIDLDRDGRLDLYVINDIGENVFYLNKGNDVFEDQTEEFRLEDDGNGMGSDICDYNNDGNFDIYLTNIYQLDPNPFFINRGNGTFLNRSEVLRVDDTGWGWGARFFDADHDMDEDLYVVNGFYSDIAAGDRNHFFLNNGTVFRDISQDHGLNSDAIGMGLEVFDYDSDGDLDMMVGNRESPVDLYINSFSSGNWFQVSLEGTISNKSGFGAEIRIVTGDKSLYRYHSGANLFGQSIRPVHFGLAENDKIDTLEVRWPSGLGERMYDLEPNQVIPFVEGSGEIFNRPLSSNPLEPTLKIYPNPFSEEIRLLHGSLTNGMYTFEIFTASGKIIHEQKVQINKTNDETVIHVGAPSSSGWMIFRLRGNGYSITGKLIREATE